MAHFIGCDVLDTSDIVVQVSLSGWRSSRRATAASTSAGGAGPAWPGSCCVSKTNESMRLPADTEIDCIMTKAEKDLMRVYVPFVCAINYGSLVAKYASWKSVAMVWT